MSTTSAPRPVAAADRGGPTPSRATDAPSRGLRHAGGVAALVAAVTYVVGIGVMIAYLAPQGFLDAQDTPTASLDFLLEHRVSLHVWYLLIYLVNGLALGVLVVALHAHLRDAAPDLSDVARLLGVAWTALVLASGMVTLVGQQAAADLASSDRGAAASTWSAVTVVADGLGGGIELVGAAWVLLVSAAGLSTARLGRGVGVLGLVVAGIGVLTVVPVAADGAASLFGLGMIVWFGLVGRQLLRGRR